MSKSWLKSLVAAALLLASAASLADIKIGFVNTERVFREAPIALAAQKKLEREFASRDAELQKMAKQARDLQATVGCCSSRCERRRKHRTVQSEPVCCSR